jgi:hypothetical protein
MEDLPNLQEKYEGEHRHNSASDVDQPGPVVVANEELHKRKAAPFRRQILRQYLYVCTRKTSKQFFFLEDLQ